MDQENKKKVEYESVLCVYDEKGELIAFYRNDINERSIKLYSCKTLSLDEIKEMFK